MYHYLFTNDLRISELDIKMQQIANLYLNNSVPTAQEDKSLNNNAKTLGYFFNLENRGPCTIEASKGNVRKVVINFINKFQFPNPRTKESYINCINDNIKIAPLRSIIKLLFVAKMVDGTNGYLSRGEILDFIFYNDAVAKSDYVDYYEVYSQIKEFRRTNNKPSSIAPEDQRHWNHEERQFREMIKVLTWSGFVDEESDNKLIIHKGVDSEPDIKAGLLDIILEEEFWDNSELNPNDFNNCKKSFAEYMDKGMEAYSEKELEPILTENEEVLKRENNLQMILYGPPGTGKSFKSSEIIRESYPSYGDVKDSNPYIFRTTIYPDYSYYDFVGSILPKVDKENDSITYDFIPGIFTKALATAIKNPKKDIYLIIEEMSRGNIAAIFGDIFQLLDRDENGVSEYTIKNDLIGDLLKKMGIDSPTNNIYLPDNLHIIGTINTSDQNVFVIDTAFKRRFEFEYVDIDPVKDPVTGEYLNNFTFVLDNYTIDWVDFYRELNKFIVKELELPEDKQIGQFFIKFNKNDSESNFRQIYNKLLQYLWEDVQAVSISDVRLFKEDIVSFADAYKMLKAKHNVFNEKLMEPFLVNREVDVENENRMGSEDG